MVTDRVERQIEIAAPVARVWRALTDHREFGEWFKVKIDTPFVAGQMSHGNVTWPGYEHLKWEALIQNYNVFIRPAGSNEPGTPLSFDGNEALRRVPRS